MVRLLYGNIAKLYFSSNFSSKIIGESQLYRGIAELLVGTKQ